MSNGFDPGLKSLEVVKVEADLSRAKLKDAFYRDLLQNNHFYVFIITLALTLSAIGVVAFGSDLEFKKYYCGAVIPLVTTYMGYAIGAQRKK